MNVDNEIYALREHVIHHRRCLHQYPETGFDLYKTRDYVLKQLEILNFDEVGILAETGIKAVIKGSHNKAEGVFAFRADMDALSIQEKTGIEFASKRKGFMHACGHDGHTAILLGFAEWLSEHKDNLNHDVVLIFQPAEESEGGALPMIQQGVLENPNVDVIFGLHIFPDVPQGKVGLRYGPLMAQTCEFDVEITGKSAHGAMPHKGVDAILAACHFVNDLQNIITRKVDPLESALISVGKLHAGERRNIIAQSVKMEGIIRTFNDKVYDIIKRNIKNLLDGMEKCYGVHGRYEEVVYYPVVYNNLQWTESVAALLCENEQEKVGPLMISEDFAYYQQKVPGVYMLLGSGNEDKGYTFPLHSDYFDFDEEILLYGIQLYKNILQNL